jgi:hypothetical protein
LSVASLLKSRIESIKEWFGSLSEYERRGLIIACTITLITRCIFVASSLLHPPVAVEVDTYRYFAIANEPGFARWFDLNDPAGYPILLKLTCSTIDRYAGILILQALLSTGSTFMLFLIGRGLLNDRWNRISITLASLSPLAMFFSSQLMTETSFGFFFMLATVLLLKFIQLPKHKVALFVGGLSLSFATLIRPSSLATIMILTILLAYAVMIKFVRLSNALTFVTGSLLLLAVYGTGLKIKYNYFGISVKGPTTLSIYYGEPIMHSAGYSQHFIDSTLAALPVSAQYLDQARPDHINGRDFANIHSALFYKLVREHPVDALKVHFLGIAQMLAWPPAGMFQLSKHFGALPANSDLREMEFQRVFFPLVKLQVSKVMTLLRERIGSTPREYLVIWFVASVAWIVVLAFALVGLVMLTLRLNAKKLPTEYWYLLATILSYILLIPHVAAGSRFRMPIEPLLIFSAAYAAQVMFERRRSHVS